MNRFRRFSIKTFLSAAMWFASAVAVLVSQNACASAVSVMAADDPPPPKSAVPDGASASSGSKPMVIQNPDGTITVQKEPPNENSKNAKVKNGLVIPAQVVAPLFVRPDCQRVFSRSHAPIRHIRDARAKGLPDRMQHIGFMRRDSAGMVD